MRSLCVDPGLAFTGWAVVTAAGEVADYGLVATDKGTTRRQVDDDARRLGEIVVALQRPAGGVDRVLIETRVGAGRSFRSVRTMTMAWTLALVLAQARGLKAGLIDERTAKKAVLGKHKGDKADVIAAIAARHPELNLAAFGARAEHVADAVALHYAVAPGGFR